jgi:hypothetical protein
MDFSTIHLPLVLLFWVFFILSMLILQMANTRNRNNNNTEANNGEDNQNVNPPPPAPPTLEQVLAKQAQMLQTMQQTLVSIRAAQPQSPPSPSKDSLKIFSAVSRLPFLMLWSRWMLMIHSSLLRRSCKWYSATTVRRCC